MAVLVLVTPQAACLAGTAQVEKTCCCTQSKICPCLPDKPCEQACALTQVQSLDKQVAGRSAGVTAVHACHLLFVIAFTREFHPVLTPAFRWREMNASPPFGGKPPQAGLCLWLI
jgi:hypothetical protein